MIEIILTVDKIPECTKVTKVTGEKSYTVRRKLKIYYEKAAAAATPGFVEVAGLKDLIAEDGTAFLISDDGSVNIVSNTTKLKLSMTIDDAIAFLETL